MRGNIIITFVLVILISLVTLVIADVSPTTYVENERLPASKVVYGSTSDVPYVRSKYHIYKGWNLVPVGELGNAPTRARDIFSMWGDEILGCSLEDSFSTWQIKYMYDYVPGIGYVGGELNYNTGDLKEPAKTEFENTLKDFYQISESSHGNIASFMLTSHWFYSDMDCSYPFESVRARNLGNTASLELFKLNQGWNLIYIPPAIVGHKFKDIKGTCNLTKINQWNPITQKWEHSSFASEVKARDFLNKEFAEADMWNPIIVKINEACNLEPSKVNPPDPGIYKPDMCVVSAPFGCNSWVIEQNRIQISIKNSYGEALQVSSVSISGCGEHAGKVDVASGAINTFVIYCGSVLQSGEEFTGDILITYNKIGESMDMKSAGTLTSKIK